MLNLNTILYIIKHLYIAFSTFLLFSYFLPSCFGIVYHSSGVFQSQLLPCFKTLVLANLFCWPCFSNPLLQSSPWLVMTYGFILGSLFCSASQFFFPSLSQFFFPSLSLLFFPSLSHTDSFLSAVSFPLYSALFIYLIATSFSLFVLFLLLYLLSLCHLLIYFRF